jgi:hypothetical protein
MLRFARGDSAAVAVALSESLLVALLERAAARYLDRVDVQLVGLPGHGEGDLEIGTPFGKMKAGAWSVQVEVQELTGRLSADPPALDLDGHRVHVELPVRIVDGRGAIALDFQWDSKSIFNVVCNDFETRQVLRGRVRPQRHVIRGDLVLSSNPRGIVVDPEFPRERYPISMELDAASWERIRGALEDQDKLSRCGLMMNPDSVVRELRGLGIRGLRFRLPRVVYRTFVLPASLSESVRILDAPVRLTVRPHRLRIASGIFWYGADVEVRRSRGPDHRLPLPGGSEPGS